MLFRPSLPGGVFLFIRGRSFEQKVFSHRGLSFEQKEQQQEEKVAIAKINPFLWVSEVTLGSFWSQF